MKQINKFIIPKILSCLIIIFSLVLQINNVFAVTAKKAVAPNRGYYNTYNTGKKPFTASRGSYYKCIDVKATAYTAKSSARTASGAYVCVGNIAVDPKVIPMGTKLYIKSIDGSKDYGYAVASDKGSAIKGNKVDLFFNTYGECLNFGVRTVRVYFIIE